MKKASFYIKTLGCKVNQYESQVIREGFLRKGHEEADSILKADICVINTCTVTSMSDSKSLRLVRSAIKGGKKCVIVTGCMTEDRDLNLTKFSGARFIVRNKDKYRIPEIIDNDHRSRVLPRETGKGQGYNISGLKGHTRVFVKIQDGCDNVCSYCKVRIVRGKSRSRAFSNILNECRTLIAKGTKEIILTGICLGAYGADLKEDINLSKLIAKICRIDGDWRLRLSSIEPKDINEELLSQFQKQKRLCRHLHIPFQSGDNDVLKKMKRPYTRNGYLRIVEKIKRSIPDVAISVDIMVGFPGETEERFQNTMDFIKTVKPMRMHIFPFSKRKGTAAYGYRDNPGSVKKERRDKISDLSKRLSLDFLERFLDKDVELLLEDRRDQDGYLRGYTDTYIKVYIDGPDILKGQFVNCRPTLTNHQVCGILLS